MSSYSNNTVENRNEELDLRDIFATLRRYKKSIFITTIFTLTVTLFYVLTSTSQYQATLTLQIQPNETAMAQGQNSDVMATALDTQGRQNVEDEIAIIQSYSTIIKALQATNVGTRYYSVGFLKNRELYTGSPFYVKAESIVEQIIDIPFTLKPLDQNRYMLSVDLSLKEEFFYWLASVRGGAKEKMVYSVLKKLQHFKQECHYNAPVENEFFRLTVVKNGDFQASKYRFTIAPNEFLAPLVLDHLTVTVGAERSNVVILNYEDNTPHRAQEILDALANAYIAQSVERKVSVAKKTLSFIDKQLEAINHALKSSSGALQDYKSTHLIIDPREQGIDASREITLMQNQSSDMQMQINVLKNLLYRISNNKETVGIDLGSINEISPNIMTLIEKLQAADALYATLIIDYTEEHPAVIKAAQQINKFRSNLKATIESSLASINERKNSMDKIIATNRGELQGVPQAEQDLAQLTNRFAVNQKVYEYLLQKRAETAIIESSTASSVRIIDPALVGDEPVKPKKVLILLVGAILGFILGIMQALLRNLVSDRIQSISDVQSRTSLELIGVLPHFGDKKSLFEDALRVILTRFEFGIVANKHKIITFTSSIEGEGKTTTALEFAKVAAQSGRKVIVLDMDLRSGKLYQAVGSDNESGMSEFLRSDITFMSVVKHFSGNLDGICSGNLTYSNSYELLMSERFRVLLDDLRGMYDYIVLLSPPMGLVADALVLMRMSDINIVLYRGNYSKKSFLDVTNRFIYEHQMEEKSGILLNALDLNKIRPWRRK